ncbi:hypothetical protein M1L60_03050 [Actinoplanes sp. TRM 88003]|uniref:Integral membrane protein n=1 Tax=Paractinoplanes aksuensis TaxID=2939490 RepID=A0ABT1DFI8_9ACTN|nr:hypothetical protein [Actinoplanes aksuensis]MCO8269565.1 hypothetical protein [Actinoplanes aksuensis]
MEQAAELRVHGVSGTPIESMLDDPWPTQVAGDDDGRIFRRTHATPPDRVVEGYHWGRYTAGSPSRALWLLLLPFALVNVARFALLMPARRRRRDRLADGVLRLLGLLSTVTMVVAACYLAWGVLARQCGPDDDCGRGFWLLARFSDRSDGIRTLVTALLPIVLLAVLWQFDRLGFPHDPPGRPRRERPHSNGDPGDPGFWRGPLQTSSQRAAHVTVGCAVAGLLALAMLGLPGRWAGYEPAFTAACAVVAGLLGAGLLANLYVVIANPAPAVLTSDGHDTTALSRRMRVARYVTAAAALAAVVLSAHGLDHVLRGRVRPQGVGGLFAGVANGVSALLGLTLLVFLVVCAWLACCADGREMRAVPKPFRPFFGGMAGWIGAALGAVAGMGMSAAAVFWTARALGKPVLEGAGDGIEVASVYWVLAAVWGGLALLLAVSLLPMAAWLLRREWWWVLFLALVVAVGVGGTALVGDEVSWAGAGRQAEWITGGIVLVVGLSFLVFLLDRDSYPDQLCGDYSERHGLERARARVAAKWRLALIRYRYHHVLGLIALLGGLAVIAAALAGVWLIFVEDGSSPLTASATGPLGQLGVAVVSFGATGLVVLGLGTWRRAGLRTGVGIVWDLLSFWPRTGHPLCPPPYGGKAVLAVAGRASQLANQPLVGDGPAGRIVLSGHSQGSVITAAACAVLAEEATRSGHDGDLRSDRARTALGRLSMITYGSQLQFLYARFFPSYFGYDRLCGVYRGLGGRWRSVYRWTDPLGGPVLAWAAPSSAASFGPDIDRWHRIGCPDDCPGHTSKQRCGCPGGCAPDECPYPKYWAVGPDLRLRDPATIEDSAFEARRAARGHSGYPGDPAYEKVFEDLLQGHEVDPGACGVPGQATSAGSASQDRISGRISMAPK